MSASSPSRLFDQPWLFATAIAEATDDVIFAKDLEGRYQFANPATLTTMGRAAQEVLGRTDLECMPDAADARRIMANDRQVLSSGQPMETEESLVMPDGSVRYWLTRKMPLRDAQGTLVGLLGIAREVTERKAADAQREAARLKLEMGVQAAGLVMAEIDYRTNQNHISTELAQLLELGDTEMTVPRQAIFDRIHPADRQRYLDAIARTIDPAGDGHLAIDVRALLPSGTVRWLHIRLQVTFVEIDGRLLPDKGICAARDVTVEMQADRKLRAAQRLAKSVIEGSAALVYAKDLAGRYILSNEAWRVQHGVTERDVARGIDDERLFGPEAAAVLRANDRRVAEGGRPVQVEEAVAVGGQRLVFRSSKFPLYDETGAIYAVCGVSTDITDVLEADRRKDEFIATLAHELRNPLAPLRNGLEILRRTPGMPPQVVHTRDMMERQLRHMVRLVDDLLDVSRISRGKLELRREPMPLQRAMEEALETSRPALEAAGHQVCLELAPDPVMVSGDGTRLAQVFANLLHNAAKYTPPGGRISVVLRTEGGDAEVAVVDNGMGINAAMLPHVFDLFAQSEDVPRNAQGGLGIGLWLVRRLVELHGGRIDAHSDGPGRGSRFRVRLPLLPESAARS
ncbi:PAS domain-containing protein [Ramlibacter algicola]|uniref:histidine kinase n=1 Tax=Ramlibacter algicola TaxID=2795217 RepID=A0A934Q4Y9_9BURK|nr:PAS domain-containing protein [Ramlibacter algicola]MBK0394349.1 PAS domain-containing protein [Ramlibacter algicola]